MNGKRSERALELFHQHYNCAQSVYAACGAGSEEGQRLAVAAAFGGGIAGQGEVCGALTGALMAVGESEETAIALDPVGARTAVYERARELTASFRALHGSILCRELTGCLMSTEEGMKSFKERELRQNLCCGLVAFAADRVV